MALLQNQTHNAQYPRRMAGGGSAVDPAMWGRSERRNIFTQAAYDPKSGVPLGYLAPPAWTLPQKTGGLSSHREIRTDFTLGGAGARGVNGEAALTAAWTFDGTGQTVVSGSANIDWSIAVTGNAVATLNAEAAITGTWSVAATIGALANMNAGLTGTWLLASPPYATGSMEASISTDTVLSPNSLATAVWQRVIEAGYSAEEVLRLIAAVTAGDATGLESGSPSFEGIDETTIRVAGTYSGGTRNVTTRDAS